MGLNNKKQKLDTESAAAAAGSSTPAAEAPGDVDMKDAAGGDAASAAAAAATAAAEADPGSFSGQLTGERRLFWGSRSWDFDTPPQAAEKAGGGRGRESRAVAPSPHSGLSCSHNNPLPRQASTSSSAC